MKNNNNNFNETTIIHIFPKIQNDLKKFAGLLQPPLKKVSELSTASRQTFFSFEKENGPFQQLPFAESISLPETVGNFVTKNAEQQILVCIDNICDFIQFYDSQHKSWHSSPVALLLPNEQKKFKLAQLGRILYAFGGWDYRSYTTNRMWSVDLNDPSFQWTARANMKQSRKWFSSVVLNDTIYAIGGEDNNNYTLRSCERYCSQLNQWSTVADTNIDRAGVPEAVINGCIYVVGGDNEKEVLKSVCKYCPETDTWSEVAPMTTGRKRFALTPFAGRLWAIGGMDEYFQKLSSCESYDPVTDTWREEAPMKGGRWRHAAIEFNGELYVVGGWSSGGKTKLMIKFFLTILHLIKMIYIFF